MAKLKDISIQFISLVDKAANHREFIFKSDGKLNGVIQIRKVDTEKRLVLGVVYTPNEIDSQGDWADKEAIELCAHDFLKNQLLHNVDSNHDFNPEKGYVCESWIIRGDDPLFPDEKEGTWAVVIRVEDDATWEMVKAGDLAGLSFAGTARKEEIGKGQSFTEFIENITQLDLPWQMANYIYYLVYDAAYEEDFEGLIVAVSEAINEFIQMREAA